MVATMSSISAPALELGQQRIAAPKAGGAQPRWAPAAATGFATGPTTTGEEVIGHRLDAAPVEHELAPPPQAHR